VDRLKIGRAGGEIWKKFLQENLAGLYLLVLVHPIQNVRPGARFDAGVVPGMILRQHIAMNIELKPSGELQPAILASIKKALAEDIGSGDVTTDPIVSPDAQVSGQIVAKQSGVVVGLAVAEAVFRLLDQDVRFTANASDGSLVERGDTLAELAGSARAILTAERTALNFLGRMSGIATLTRQFVDQVAGTKARILDTRKTAPGLRAVDKLAVQYGGGYNHRHGLYDMILIKDNHIDFAGSLAEAVRLARVSSSDLEAEVEARTLEDVESALQLGVRRILLDNMSIKMIKEAVQMTAGHAKLEASGNVTLESVRQLAETGVDYISVGELTHSVRVFDVSLRLRPHPTND
jgi:nicotinate-nucleotide pyrophosphorylase (carboxylating)